MTVSHVCPWPGPKPYAPSDADRFYGREKEVEKLLQVILHQKLSILIAASGVGKTSLLQAGLVPMLRARRSQGELTVGHVILVRRWGELEDQDAAILVVKGVRKAIEALYEETCSLPQSSRLRMDAQAAYDVEVPNIKDLEDVYDKEDAALSYIYWLTNSVGNLILIIDQAEELMGSGLGKRDPIREEHVLDLFSNIFRRIDNCHLMLSMRDEYLPRLTSLGAKVGGGLEGRTHVIEQLPRRRVYDAMHKASEVVQDVVIDSSEGQSPLSTIIGWLAGREEPTDMADATHARMDGETEPVDLLRLQALLVEIFEYAKMDGNSPEQVIINGGLLRSYRNRIMARAVSKGEKFQPSELGKQSLEHYIERIFTRHAASASSDTPPGLLRYLVVRMTRWLSSPEGFKRHVRDLELIYNALREDLEALITTVDAGKVRNALGTIDNLDELDFTDQRDDDYSSGFTWGWPAKKIGKELADSAHAALRLLVEEEVLKISKGDEGHIYELVHDGFGPALYEWAEQCRREVSDTVAAIVSRRGESFLWTPTQITGRTFERVRWLGCNLKGLSFKNITFKDSDLRGSIFMNCSLEDCRFERCNLDGTVFKEGSWKNVVLQDSRAKSTLIVRTKWEDQVTMSNCFLENASWEAVKLGGNLTVADSNLRFAQLRQFIPLPSVGEVLINRCDLNHSVFEDLPKATVDEDSDLTSVIKEYSEAAFGPKRSSTH